MSTQGYVPIETPVRMLALEIDGKPVKIESPRQAKSAELGIALVEEPDQ